MSESNIIFSTIHYIITLIFFLIVFFNILSLTKTTINMDVDSSDKNAKTAKDLMISAISIGYLGELIIIIFLIVVNIYSSNQDDLTRSYYDKLMGTTGAENLYAAMRIISFSILMFISLVIAVLCKEAANNIDSSNDPSKYEKEYDECITLAEMFFAHFVMFTIIQGIAYLYQLFYNDGGLKVTPGQIATGKKIN